MSIRIHKRSSVRYYSPCSEGIAWWILSRSTEIEVPINSGPINRQRIESMPNGVTRSVAATVRHVQSVRPDLSAVPERFRSVSMPGASPVPEALRATSDPRVRDR